MFNDAVTVQDPGVSPHTHREKWTFGAVFEYHSPLNVCYKSIECIK